MSIREALNRENKQKVCEIVVIDNGSTDGSIDMLKKEFPEVKRRVNKKNIGFGAANNLGVEDSLGKYVLFLNPDTEIQANTLTTILSYMEENLDVGIATCRVLLQSGVLDDASHRGFPTPWRALCHFSGLGKLFPKSTLFNGYHLGYQNMDRPHEIDACAGAFLLIRRSVGEEVQWFDEDYFWYGEDLDLCYRVKMLHHKVMFLPQVSILHHKGASSGMKKHSEHLSKIDSDTRRKITSARFEVMKTFYNKHYRNAYPRWLMALVFIGIDVKRKLTEISL